MRRETGDGADARTVRGRIAPYRGTPLVWAVVKGRVDAADWLLHHGADVNQRSTFGTVRFLLQHGADASIEDALYRSTPAGWAKHFGAAHATAELEHFMEQRGS